MTSETDDLVAAQRLAERFRQALLDAGRATGAYLHDSVSDEFLLLVPGEVRGKIDAQDEQITRLRARIAELEAMQGMKLFDAKSITLEEPQP